MYECIPNTSKIKTSTLRPKTDGDGSLKTKIWKGWSPICMQISDICRKLVFVTSSDNALAVIQVLGKNQFFRWHAKMPTSSTLTLQACSRLRAKVQNSCITHFLGYLQHWYILQASICFLCNLPKLWKSKLCQNVFHLKILTFFFKSTMTTTRCFTYTATKNKLLLVLSEY